MEKMKKIMMGVVCLICIFLIVTITMKYVNPIVIDTVEPISVVAGQDFNLFEGKSTMALYGKGFKEGDTIYLNNEPQDTAIGNQGWMTCFVNEGLYQEPGELEIQVKRKNESGRVIKKSNIVIIPIQ